MLTRSALAALALTLAAPLPAQAQADIGSILEQCANTARSFFNATSARTNMRYNGARVDGTETVGGEIYLNGRTPYIACAFSRGSLRMTEFFVDGDDQSSFATASGGTSSMPVFSAQCPQGNTIDADRYGTVRVNGAVASVTVFNRNYFEVYARGVTYSISQNDDGSGLLVSYQPPGSAGGYCEIMASGSGGGSGGGGTASGTPGAGETDTMRVQFDRGTSGTELSDNLPPGASRRYVLGAGDGQFLYVRVAPWSGSLDYQIFNPDGSFLLDMVPSRQEYRGQLWQDGDHVVEVINRTNRTVSYNVIFGID
ncbi:hypothetical protein KUV65_04710 [Maritalea mobilis]|uniref:hypothetical protein n=1 Tax=Maritalea mobilis TaxID=483324 RepID=UPI001C95C282|nr:hypothetical protein [Maritalea mobilis]MBY6200652.1 hypothetical protein [Maritalea mobilis]